ncbi:matrixin family metalloprotease [Blastococcus sp. CT_GayMR20]|uniref:matrixin family metalloprotease n=1 Tax=Blastococcus sp. CT_GayMR20 TaxID=2559609 RepID=UPI001073CA2E|nr:matrixin family metalloprotease [Blastococcus sp. CT_GayMR20]TFV85792.1 matrixin family metalloprotease [Blastococcus sp. CT_GayMR20]
MHGDRDDEGKLLGVPTSPTGRVPQWVLDEAAGLPVQPMHWRPPTPPPPPRRRRRGRGALRALLVVVLVVFLAVGSAVLVGPGPWPWAPRTEPVPAQPPAAQGELPDGAPEPSAVPVPTDRPTPGHEAARRPLATPPPPPPEGGPHTFVTFQVDGVTPVAYDPCRPVHYVLRPDAAPPGGDALLHEAFARLGEVTGLRFIHDGASDEPATHDRELYQPDRYGNRWAPVLVAWETEEQNPALAGDIVGEAGSVAVSLGDGPRVFVTGTVSLDAGTLPELLDRPDGEDVVRSIVLHELGHLVGLGHVDDASQLLYPKAQQEVTDYASGDLTGLSRLGSGTCVPDL